MLRNALWLAQAEVEGGATSGAVGRGALELLILVGALLLVTVLVVIWAAAIRKRRRTRRSHHHCHHRSRELPVSRQARSESAPTHQGHKHQRRHEHLPRNPTLAETGGLPPLRPDNPPPASPPS